MSTASSLPVTALTPAGTRTFYTVLIICCSLFIIPLIIQSQNSSSSKTSSTSHQKSSADHLLLSTNSETIDQIPDDTDATPAAAAAVSNSDEIIAFSSFFSTLLKKFVSSEWRNIFDENILVRDRVLDGENEFPCFQELTTLKWEMMSGIYNVQEKPPSCFSDLKTFTKSVHYFISVGLSRIAADKSLSNRYVKLQKNKLMTNSKKKNAQQKLDTFELRTAQMIVSYLQATSISLQIWVDGFPGVSPESIISELMRNNRKPKSSSDNSDNRSNVQKTEAILRKRKNKAAFWLLKRSRLVTVHPHFLWSKQLPVNGRFWNNFRQTLPCSSLHRTCENPEGCRFLCNFEYSLDKVATAESKRYRSDKKNSNDNDVSPSSYAAGSSSSSPNLYTIVGFGSNNEFDWEDSMINEFQRKQLFQQEDEFLKKSKIDEKRKFASGITSITTFDCTLITRPGHPGVQPSPTVKKIGNRFRFVPFCLNGQPDPLLSVTNDQLSKNEKGKDFQKLFASKEAEAMSISIAELRQVLEWKDAEQQKIQSSATSSSRKINLFKLDIESFEYLSLARWLQLDLYQTRKQLFASTSSTAAVTGTHHQKDSDGATLIDFQKFPFLEVEQLQIELHRRGHKSDRAAGVPGALWMLWPQLTMYALGMMPVVAEKNHFDNCCFEQVLVHYRFYVESELSFV